MSVCNLICTANLDRLSFTRGYINTGAEQELKTLVFALQRSRTFARNL